MATTADTEWASVPEAARMLGVAPTTMHSLLDAGAIPYVKPSKHRRVLVADVLRYKDARTYAGRAKLATLTDDPLAD